MSKRRINVLGTGYRRICVYIVPLQLDQWGQIEAKPVIAANDHSLIQVTGSDVHEGDITISIDRSFIGSVAKPDNSAERPLMVEIIRAIRDTFAVRHAELVELLCDASIDVAIDEFALWG
jgi:hypothetical protein